MRKYIIEIEQVESKRLTEVICNKCGKNIDFDGQFAGCDVEFSFGYGSSRDGDLYQVDFCNECIEELFSSFVVQPVNTGVFWPDIEKEEGE